MKAGYSRLSGSKRLRAACNCFVVLFIFGTLMYIVPDLFLYIQNLCGNCDLRVLTEPGFLNDTGKGKEYVSDSCPLRPYNQQYVQMLLR